MTTLQQMLAASESGDVSLVRSLLDEGAAVDAADHEGATPLQTAAANGREEIARLLLMRGAALDRANAYGWSALMQAARAGHHPVVALLLQHKADADRRNLLGASALALAARGGHVSVVRLLLDAGADPDPCGAACEFTALVAAATHGADPVARLLLDRGGGDAAHRMLSTGASALMAAAQNGHMTTCQLLVERGCDANATDVCERTALDLARERHCKEVQGYLERKTTHRPKKDKKDTKPDIIDSAKAGDLKTVLRILDNDPLQVNCVDKDGATALMFAAMLGKQDIVELLVQRGADVNKQDKVSHWTALMQAVYHGKKLVAKYLLSVGADVNKQARNGCTAFDLASLIDDMDTDVVRMLAASMVKATKPAPAQQQQQQQQQKLGGLQQAWQPGISSSTPMLTTVGSEDGEHGGLKAWWSRMSNRFHQLKLMRTFRFSSNQLAPLPVALDDEGPSPRGAGRDDSLDTSLLDSINTLLLDTAHSSMMSLGNIGARSNLTSDTLKPVLPPFLPPPTFELSESNRARMPMGTRKKKLASISSTATLSPSRRRKAVKPYKFLSATASVSPSNSSRFSAGIPSPNSSGGASSIPMFYQRRMASSYSVDNFHLGAESKSHSPSHHLWLPTSAPSIWTSSSRHGRPPTRSPVLRRGAALPGGALPGGALPGGAAASGGQMLTPRKSSTLSSTSRSSTLTPDPSPRAPEVVDASKSNSDTLSNESQKKVEQPSATNNDELCHVLKKISLERYQPIFEEQEVDLEAFLTLTDADLTEIGITQRDPRQRILRAIAELQNGKGKERQLMHDTVKNFHLADAAAAATTTRCKMKTDDSCDGDEEAAASAATATESVPQSGKTRSS